MFRGNKIYLYDKNGKKHRIFFIPGVFVRFRGKNSVIELHSPIPKFKRGRIECRDNARISIGSSKYTCSLVTKDCATPNSIYAGHPAKMIKTNTNWDRSFPRETIYNVE